MLPIAVLPASALRCVPRAPAGEGLGEVGEGILASPPARRGTSLLCFCSLAGAEFSAARLGGCGRISYHFLSGVGREVWVHRYVFTQLTYAFLLVFSIRRGCAQCACTLSICYFRRSWVFLTYNFSWNCVPVPVLGALASLSGQDRLVWVGGGCCKVSLSGRRMVSCGFSVSEPSAWCLWGCGCPLAPCPVCLYCNEILLL